MTVHRPAKLHLSIALPGGGAHGAYSWGVLDALMEWQGRTGLLELDMLVGASSGAVNAAALLRGLHEGGPEGARHRLASLWQATGRMGMMPGLSPGAFDRAISAWGLPNFHLGWSGFDTLVRSLSPYQMNPLGINPLRPIFDEQLPADRLAAALAAPDSPRLYVSTTDAETGAPRLFEGKAVTAEVLLASGTLPFLMPAEEIDGSHLWDGSYSGNPPLAPILQHGRASDLLIVDITPARRPEVPTSPTAIFDRLTEIAMAQLLENEIAAIEKTNRLIESGALDAARAGVRPLRLHRVSACERLGSLPAASKLDADPAFIDSLFEDGQRAGRRWLDTIRPETVPGPLDEAQPSSS
jgi:NTE family protein